MSREKKHTLATVFWLVGTTKDLIAPLALASVFSCLTRLASIGIYLFAAVGLCKALGLESVQFLSSLSWWWLAASIVLLSLFKGILRYLEQYVGHRVAFLSLARLRRQMYSAFERQAPFNASTKNSGRLLARATSDIDKVEVFFAHTLPPAVAAILVSALSTWGAWAVFGQTPALILLGAYLLIGLIIPCIGLRTLRTSAEATASSRSAQNQLMNEALWGIEVLHSFRGGNTTLQKLRANTDQAGHATVRTGTITAIRSTLTQLTIWGSLLTLFLVLGWENQLGAVILLGCIAVPSYEAVRTVDGFVLGLQDSLASARRLHATATAKPDVAEATQPVDLPQSGTLEALDLGISYGQQQVVIDVNFHVAPGGMLGFVGESGSGKSSLAAAIVRSLNFTGSITFGGVDITQTSLNQLRSKIMLVSQEAIMVRGTLRENLRLGRKEISDERLEQVLAELGLGLWLKQQKSGLDTRLGDRSTRLSGGQRQRLALARALVRDPQVLILDESTSALDSDSEQLVLQAIERRRQAGMSVIMISHRLATVGHADQILVLEDGRVAESGSAQELLADKNSLFSQMAIREVDRILPA